VLSDGKEPIFGIANRLAPTEGATLKFGRKVLAGLSQSIGECVNKNVCDWWLDFHYVGLILSGRSWRLLLPGKPSGDT